MALTIAFPGTDEYAAFHNGYMAAVAGEPDALPVLERQQAIIEALGRLTPEQAAHRYAVGKWSVREIIGHLSDAERILAYRLLCIARGDQTPLPGFDEEAYGAQTNADRRTLGELVEELAVVRLSTLALVRSLAFVIAGHFEHHVHVLGDRYDIAL